MGGKRCMQFAIFINSQFIAFTHPIFIGCIIDILMPINRLFLSINQISFFITKRNILIPSRFSRRRLRRQHVKACTGHHTRCNQHCQQLFSRAAFAASILRDFRNNNVSIACFVPNDFKYLVHTTFLQTFFYIYLFTWPQFTRGSLFYYVTIYFYQ